MVSRFAFSLLHSHYHAYLFPALRKFASFRPFVRTGEAARFVAFEGRKRHVSNRLSAHDFFTKQPIMNAAVYLLRFIIHDWPTAYAQKILRQLRDAAQPSTKLILADHIAPYLCKSMDTFSHIEGAEVEAVPAPLSNMGIAGNVVCYMDMQVSVISFR